MKIPRRSWPTPPPSDIEVLVRVVIGVALACGAVVALLYFVRALLDA